MSHQPQPPAAAPGASGGAASTTAVSNSASSSAAANVYRPPAAIVPPPATAAAIPPPQYPTQYPYPYAQYSPYQHPAYTYQYYSHPSATTSAAVPPPTYKPTLSLSNTSIIQSQPPPPSLTHTQLQPQYQYHPQRALPQAQPSTSAPTAQPAQPVQSQAHVSTKTAPKKAQSIKGTFARELRTMMYAFGDSKEPAFDSVDVMEDILIEYLIDICHSALASTRKTRIQIEDLRRALSRFPDGTKLARLEELLFMQDDIRRARKQFSTEEDSIQAQILE